MTLTIELTPTEQARLEAAAQREGIAPADLARKLVTEHLPAAVEKGGEEDPTLALFAQWAEEDARMTPEEFEQDRRLWEQFEKGVNESRQALGMGPL